ncbi:cell wall hydrolase [Floricoccus tropicus]|uniref:N-acetylmuramoyl-L-alanine amidase n=1 Tax=Floricoccus tropicus TaxID=1859473 RepID=A0A1E8GNE0_9LACT|nr:CHAP domain-containing protein [Floricoccus tropicus]OFI49516.1 cell wall hydrolase [Floricoccus tropicus]
MTKKNEVINYACDLANKGVGVDADGVYGTQCVDLPNWICTQFFGVALWGNAIDLLNSAAAQGFKVEYNEWNNPNSVARAGAFFVMQTYDHPYGHTGLVIKDGDGYTLETVEQNVEGVIDGQYHPEALEIGGPARYIVREYADFEGEILGWFYPPYSDTPATKPPTSGTSTKVNEEYGTFTVEVSALNVRDKASLSGNVVATYGPSMEINYDGWLDSDGYIWVTYIAASGNRRYVAVGNSENGRRVTNFGSFR